MVPRPKPVPLPYGPSPSGPMHPTPGVFTICTAMCGNGRPIGSGGIPSGDFPIRKVLPPACPVSSEVVPGSFPLPTFDVLLEAEAHPSSDLMTWDSVLLSSRSNKDLFLAEVLASRLAGVMEEGYEPSHAFTHFAFLFPYIRIVTHTS